MIKRIYADNYRCLGNFEFRPKQLNLLLGENGSGKSNLFQVLQNLQSFVLLGRSAKQLFSHTKTVWDQRSIQSFELEIEDDGGIFTYRLEIQHSSQQVLQPPQVAGESLRFDGKPLYRYRDGQVHLFGDDHEPGPVFPFKADQGFLPNLEAQGEKIQRFKDFLGGIHIFQLNPFSLDPFSQLDQRYLTFNGSNFVSWLRYLSDENPLAKLECEKRLAELIPGFQRFRFQSMGDRKGLVAVFSREDGENFELFLNNLSEGQRILAILYSILYGLAEQASVLCFDEPENYISLQEVQPWLQGLRDLVEEHSRQVLLISHHPEVIDYLADDSGFRLDRPSGDITRVSPWTPDPEEIMKPSEILVRGG